MRSSTTPGRDLTRLRLLASAIAGRALDVSAAGPGERTWTDGSTVFLEEHANALDEVLMLSVQASLLAAGSLDPDVIGHLSRHRGLTKRYLAVEGHRALAVNEAVLPPLVRPLINQQMAESVSTPNGALTVARERRAIADPPAMFGSIWPRRVRRLDQNTDPPGEHQPSAADVAEGVATSELADLEELDDGEETNFGDLLSSPVGGGGPIGRLLKRLLKPARHRRGGGPPGADAPTHRARPGSRPSRRAAVSKGPARGLKTDEPFELFESVGATYPEWDLHRRRYRVDWCTVVETEARIEPGASSMPDPIALRRTLARLGMGLTPSRRQKQGSDIDIDAAVEACVDSIAGLPHEDDFYIDSLRRRRDLSVLVLLDVSGSSGEPGTAGRTVHEHQKQVAAGLTTALHGLGDRVALYAFNSRGRRAVQVMRVKGFDDHLDGRAALRLGGLVPAAYTRLGAAIRHGTRLLDERSGTPRRLLVVLSDGFAYDQGYQGRYGEADARRALSEARRRGVGCLCLSVGTDTGVAVLQRVFGASAHATIPHVEQLPTLVGPLFAAALRSAEVQRRRFQRKERTRERLEIERRTHEQRDAPVLRSGRG